MTDKLNLTELEEKLLKVAANRGGRLSLEELARDAECDVAQIYKRLQNNSFRTLFTETLRHSLSAEVPGILNAFIAEAHKGSFKHGKLLLEIAQMYTEEKKVTGDFSVRESESPFVSEEEKKKFAEQTLGKLGLFKDKKDNGGA